MRIIYWSADVCSSDLILVIVDEKLPPGHRRKARQEGVIIEAEEPIRRRAGAVMRLGQEQHALLHDLGEHRQTVGIGMPAQLRMQAFEIGAGLADHGVPLDLVETVTIGRASCRERVCQYV